MIDSTSPDVTDVGMGDAGGDARTDDLATTALATVREVTGEITRLVRMAATQATDGLAVGAFVRSVLSALERGVEEHTALGRDARALRVRGGELEERVRELEALLAAREAGWKAERAAFEDDVARERERAETLTQDLAQRRAEIAVLEGRTRRLREQAEAAVRRGDADREKTFALARDMVHSAEEARFAVVAELETVRAQLAAEQARAIDIQHERARATAGAAELETQLAHARRTVEQLEASRAATAVELDRACAALVRTEGEVLALQHEYQLAQAQLEKLCAAHDDMVEDQAQLVAKLHDAREREARLRLRITSLEQRAQAAREGEAAPAAPPPDAVDAVVEAATAGLAAELARVEGQARALRDEVATARAAASAATIRAETLQAEVHATEQARVAAVAALEALRAAAEPAATPEDPVVPAGDAAGPPADAVLAADDAVAPPQAAAATSAIAVLDATGVWDDAGGVVPCTGAEACRRLRDLAPACCLVDLGAPGALETAAMLRRAGIMIPLSGFAAVPTGAVALGRFDVIPRPVDPDVVQAQIAAVAPPTGTAIMVGSDSTVLLPLRQGLVQQEMAVRTAWNVEQAAGLARSLEPDAVMIDLGTAAAGAADLIVELGARERPPAVFVVPGTPHQTEELAAALAARGPVVDRTDLVRGVAEALGQAAAAQSR